MNLTYKYLIVLSAILILGCKADHEIVNKEVTTEKSNVVGITKKQFEASQMMLGQLQEKTFDKKITVNGKIHLPMKDKAIVSSMLSGSIGGFDLVEGQWVRKGQQLFTVTNPELIDLQEGYLVLKSKLAYLKEEVHRMRKLVDENLGARKDLMFTESEYESSLTNFNSIEKKLKLYGISVESLTNTNLQASVSVLSPISGYVSKINALRGQYISPSSEVITIDNRSDVHLEINILERDAPYISKGQNITFYVQGMPNEKNEAQVYLMYPAINDNGMVSVHCQIKDDVSNLLPGMFATADIILDSYTALAIEETATVRLDGKDHILVEKSSIGAEIVFEPIAVEVGMIQNGFVEILNAQDLRDKNILVKGAYYLVN